MWCSLVYAHGCQYATFPSLFIIQLHDWKEITQNLQTEPIEDSFFVSPLLYFASQKAYLKSRGA